MKKYPLFGKNNAGIHEEVHRKGVRYIDNLVHIVSPEHDGKAYSGTSIELEVDGLVEIPINYDGSSVQGSVSYFNFNTTDVEQITALPLSNNYELKDGKYGIIIKLHVNQFTQADLNIFTKSPEDIIKWYNGIDVGISIIKGVDDRVYFPLETTYSELDESETLSIQGTFIRNTNEPSDIQLIGCNTNVNGLPIDVLSSEINVKNGYLDSELNANTLNTCSIVANVETVEGIVEERIHVKDNTNDILYVNGVKQFVSFADIGEHTGKGVELSGDGLVEIPINYNGSTVQGSVTYLNATSGLFEQVGADSIGSKELIVNGDFSDGLNGWGNIIQGRARVENEKLILQCEDTDTPSKYPSIRQKVGMFKDKFFTYSGLCESVTLGDKAEQYMQIQGYSPPPGLDHRPMGTPTTVGTLIYINNIPSKDVGSNMFITLGGHFPATPTRDDYCVFDNISLKETLPLSTHYQLRDGTYGIICKLHTNHFTQDDLNAMNNDNKLMIDWYLGNTSLPSGIVRSSEDKCYYNFDTKYIELLDASELPYQRTFTYHTDLEYGVQEAVLVLDPSGIPIRTYEELIRRPEHILLENIPCIGSKDKDLTKYFDPFEVHKIALPCPNMQPSYETLANYNFNCGIDNWTFDPNYSAEVSWRKTGEGHVKSTSNFGSFVPTSLPNTNDGEEWVARCKVKNITGGDGKMSIRLGSTWHNTDFTNGAGIYEKTFTGNLTELHCGASGTSNTEMDFEWISLRHVSDPNPADFMIDSNNVFIVDDNDKYLIG